MNSQQVGKFYIEEKLIRRHPNVVASALRDMNFVPLRTELIFASQVIEYTGISPMFDKNPPKRHAPGYKVNIIFNLGKKEKAEYVMVEVTNE